MSANHWRNQRVPVCWGIPDTHIETGECYSTRTLAEIFAMQPGNRTKSHGLAMLAGNWDGHDARCHAVQAERGRFVTLAGDIDKGDWSLRSIAERVHAFAGDAATLIYSTPHSRPGDRRWRILLPLAAPVGFDLWQDAQLGFFAHMEAAGVPMDHALALSGQLIYLPNVPGRHGASGEPLRGPDGAPLYFRRWTNGTDAPGLDLSAGPIARAIADVRALRVAEEQELERRRVESERKRASRPQHGETLIDAFNRDNPVERLLERYRYEQSTRNRLNWRLPLQSGTSFATQVIGGGKWFSLSQSDADAGLGKRLRGGSIGDAFDLFVHFEHGGDRSAALRQLRSDIARVAA